MWVPQQAQAASGPRAKTRSQSGQPHRVPGTCWRLPRSISFHYGSWPRATLTVGWESTLTSDAPTRQDVLEIHRRTMTPALRAFREVQTRGDKDGKRVD